MITKSKIITSVTPLFLRNGFKGLTVDDIASELGISKKTIYKHFSSKELLIDAVRHHLVNFSNVVNDQVEPFADNCVDQMYGLIQLVEKEFGFHQLRINLQEAQHYYTDISDDLVRSYRDVAVNICEKIIDRGIKEDLIDTKIDKHLTSLIFGQVYVFLSTVKEFKNKDAFDHSFEQWCYMIAKCFLNERGLLLLKQKILF